jgi:hypothetical protein
MIEQLITAVSNAFTRVVTLVGDIFGGEGIFGAIGDLSSNVFGN